jgi:hypothetical protein
MAPDWQPNGLGRKVSHSYGYGLMDTTAMVRLAKNWTLMPPQVSKPEPWKPNKLECLSLADLSSLVECNTPTYWADLKVAKKI